jgi:hypothetical protein
MTNTKPPQKRDFRTVLEDAKALVTVLDTEAESLFGRRTMRVLRVAVAIALLLLLLNWFISPDTAQERQGLAVVFAISLGGVAAIVGLYVTRQTLLATREHEAARASEAALRACLEQLGNLLTHKK